MFLENKNILYRSTITNCNEFVFGLTIEAAKLDKNKPNSSRTDKKLEEFMCQ